MIRAKSLLSIPRWWLLILACCGLLASQLSGLHMHIGGHGYVGIPEGTHVHGAAAHVHEEWLSAQGDDLGTTHSDHAFKGHRGGDHTGDQDVSVLDWGVAATKLLIVLASLVFGLVLTLRLGGKLRIPAIIPVSKARRDRWRPPLRAPPFPLAT